MGLWNILYGGGAGFLRPFESHIYLTKNTDTQKGIGIFYGVDNGIRTHDLQSHNLTR